MSSFLSPATACPNHQDACFNVNGQDLTRMDMMCRGSGAYQNKSSPGPAGSLVAFTARCHPLRGPEARDSSSHHLLKLVDSWEEEGAHIRQRATANC